MARGRKGKKTIYTIVLTVLRMELELDSITLGEKGGAVSMYQNRVYMGLNHQGRPNVYFGTRTSTVRLD